MQGNPFEKGKQMNRDERWEARRRAKLGMNAPDPNFLNPAAPSVPQIPQAVQPPPMAFPQAQLSQPVQQMALPPGMADVPPQAFHSSLPPEPAPIQNSPNLILNAFTQPQSYEPPHNHAMPPETRNSSVEMAKRRRPTPPSNSFFVNPVSEAEQKRAQVAEEYKRQMMNDMRQAPAYQPEDRARPASRGNIKMINPEKQIAEEKKRQYQAALDQQMQQRQVQRKLQSKTPPQEYFPFGKPGAGAPFRDVQGNIIAMRPPKFNENDPNYLRASEFYQKVADGRQQQPMSLQGSYNAGMPSMAQHHSMEVPPSQQMMNYPMSNQGYGQGMNQPPMGQPMMNQGMMNQGMMNQGMMNQGMMNQGMMNQGMMNQGMMNQGMMSQGGMNQGMGIQNPQMMMGNQPMSPNFYGSMNPPQSSGFQVYDQPPRMQTPPEFNIPNPPRQDHQRGAAEQPDPVEEIERIKKLQLARDLQEQIEERKRKREEERNQKLREERLEEERIRRQQREMQEEAEREAEMKRKKFQDAQSFNANFAPEPKRKKNIIDMPPIDQMPPPQPKRIRTPVEAPVPQHIDLPPPEPHRPILKSSPKRRPDQTHDVTRRVKEQLDSEMSRLKNEFHSQHNELKDAMLRLKEETQAANEHRFEAQRELERLKEELKQKSIQEELRQKELYQAVVSNPMPMIINKTRMPPPDNAPLHLKRGFDDASLSLDSTSKTLNGESKFIPLAKPDPVFPTRKVNQSGNYRKAEELDGGFPSLPDMGAGTDTIRTANSSLGIEKINRRNEERLKLLEGLDPNDEISKLDNLLLKYLDGRVPDNKPPRSSSKLDSIKEEEDFNYSLPKSRGSRGGDSMKLY